MKETFAQIVRDFGNVDVVATAAGIVDNVEAENHEHPRWRRMLNVILEGTREFMDPRHPPGSYGAPIGDAGRRCLDSL